MVKLQQITRPLELGEGLHWCEGSQSLYFVDLYASTIHKYTPSDDKHTYAKVGTKPVTFVITIKDRKNYFLISYGGDLAIVHWDGVSQNIKSFETILEIEPYPQVRLNDAKVSPSGVLFVGSMGSQLKDKSYPDKLGNLYAVDGKKIKKLISNVGISNGLAWNKQENTLYYIDTLAKKVFKFDYDKQNITINNKQTLFDFVTASIPGSPDGLTISEEGSLFVACVGGGKVIEIQCETGKLLRQLDLPCTDVTTVVFGGRNLDELYITTAYHDDPHKHGTSGCLFKITGLNVKGYPSKAITYRSLNE